MFNVTPLLKAYARFRSGRSRIPAAIQQERELLSLVRTAARTQFGIEHDFAGIANFRDYQRRVPFRFYEDFWKEYWEKAFPVLETITWPERIPFFALSSGTSTGITKYIPVSRRMIRSNEDAALELLGAYLERRPASRMLAGKLCFLGGSTDLKQAGPGIFAGDLSGIAAKTGSRLLRRYVFPDQDTALLSDWEEKVDRLVEQAPQEDLRMLSGVPSWMLLFLERLTSRHQKPIAELMPNLELYVHGGIRFDGYREQFRKIFAGLAVDYLEVYPASEGFIAFAEDSPEAGMTLRTGAGIVYEFIPVSEISAKEPVRHWIQNVEAGVDYAIVLTTCAGLWSYVLGDTVRFVQADPPRLLITGRLSYSLSAFGEHLRGEEIEDSAAGAAAEIERTIRDFTAGPVIAPLKGGFGYHIYLVEFSGGEITPERLEAFAAGLDRRLAAANADYRDHRSGDFGMFRPEVWSLAPGSFNSWMKDRGKLGGQNKVPRVIPDETKFQEILAYMKPRTVLASLTASK